MSKHKKEKMMEFEKIHSQLPPEEKRYFEGFLLGYSKGLERGVSNEEDNNSESSPVDGARCTDS